MVLCIGSACRLEAGCIDGSRLEQVDVNVKVSLESLRPMSQCLLRNHRTASIRYHPFLCFDLPVRPELPASLPRSRPIARRGNTPRCPPVLLPRKRCLWKGGGGGSGQKLSCSTSAAGEIQAPQVESIFASRLRPDFRTPSLMSLVRASCKAAASRVVRAARISLWRSIS